MRATITYVVCARPLSGFALPPHATPHKGPPHDPNPFKRAITFAALAQLDCSAALKRVTIGVPATIEFGSASNEKKNEQKHIMGATQVRNAQRTALLRRPYSDAAKSKKEKKKKPN